MEMLHCSARSAISRRPWVAKRHCHAEIGSEIERMPFAAD